MLATERRQKILAELEATGRVRVNDLSKTLDVSRMTIHRDLSQLADEGLLEKVFGGAVAVVQEPAGKEGCVMCGMGNQERTAFVVNCADGSQLQACCPHCGIMVLTAREQAVSAMAADFLHGRMINVRSAFFLVDPDLTVCCTPTVLCFGTQRDAEKFQSGFGGEIMNLVQAQTYLKDSMMLEFVR